ncbi:MAG: cation diffusion facilitator family transporter [Bacteroidales bacterium]|nr:cation diffusion facilitator family transporter [Bacteroidales bacterium]
MDREREIIKVTLVGGFLNAALLAFKFVAGIFGHSAAMIADAVHSLSDFVTDIIVLVFVRISGKPQDKNHDYGHGKYETLATTCVALVLLGVALWIFWNGISRVVVVVRGGTIQSPGMLAFWAAIVSIVLKELIFQYTRLKGRDLNSQALEANAWHHRSDALSSVGTALGISGAVLLGNNWAVLDPIASIVVGVFIVKVAVELLRNGIGELMERSLPEETEDEILGLVSAFPDVSDPHHLRTRRIGNSFAIEMHIRMSGDITLHEAHARATEIESAIKDRYGENTHVAIHVEPIKQDVDASPES